MKATIESTTKIVTLIDGQESIEARIWEGITESGIHFHLYVPRVAVHRDLDASAFKKELKEMRAPSAEISQIPLRLIL